MHNMPNEKDFLDGACRSNRLLSNIDYNYKIWFKLNCLQVRRVSKIHILRKKEKKSLKEFAGCRQIIKSHISDSSHL